MSPDKELEWKEHEHDFLDLLDKLPHHLQSPWVLNLQKLTEIMIDNNFKKYNSYIIILMMDILRNYTALIQTFGYMDTFDDVASELYNNVEYTLLQQKRTNDKLLNLLKAIIVNNQPNNKDITILQKAFHERCLSDTDIIKKSNKFNSINTSLDK